jgi:hypothetical protein
MDNELLMFDEILTEKIKEYHVSVVWNEVEITLDDVRKAIENNISVIDNESYSNCGYIFKPDEWHIGRIIYFVNNPNEIDPICLDNKCANNDILPIPIITDGNHRYMASLYLNKKYIECFYAGRLDVLNYLKGNIENPPMNGKKEKEGIIQLIFLHFLSLLNFFHSK